MINRLKGWISSRYVARLLLYFTVIGLVPVLVFSLITQNITYRSVRQQLELQTENTVMNVTVSLETVLDAYCEDLMQLSIDPDIMRFVESGYMDGETAEYPSAQTMKALLKLYSQVSGKNNELAAHVVSIEQKDGLSTATVPVNYLPPFNANWGIFDMASKAQGAVLRTDDGNPNALSNVAFSMAQAIRNAAGEITGYVVFDVYHEMLENLLNKADLSYDLNVYIADAHHFVIHSTAQESQRTLPADVQAAVDGKELRQENSLNAAYVGKELSAYQIWVIGDMSLAPANQANQYVRNAAFLAAGICIVLCVIAAMLAWRDLSNPIHRLIKTFEQLESGDLTARVRMGERKDEFGSLGNRFDQMADQIETLIKNVEEKQRRLRISEASALQAQINPHFLYNTLDLIKWNAKLGNTAEVTKITVLLGKLLRSMANFEEDIVTVEEECDLINRYLDIQTIHYGDRLVIERAIPEEVMQLRIPKLILQPVVENSIVHGFDKRLGICKLRISASYSAPYLTFLIEDNGPGIEPELLRTLLTRRERSGGIGLQNVHKRSHLHGDESCGLQIDSKIGEGTTVRLVLRTLDAQGRMLEAGESDV